MLKFHLENIVINIFMILLISSCAKGSDNINYEIINDPMNYYIIENSANLYSDSDSSGVLMNLYFLDSVKVLSIDKSGKGRMKIKLQNGTEGWVDEKYTSYIPKNWIKLPLAEKYYCYILPDKKMELHKSQDEYSKGFYYLNDELNIGMAIVFMNDYRQDYENKLLSINTQINAGYDKRFNWNKEFIFGNYKINYVITTDHPDGYVCEMFDFVKLDEMNLKKYYYITFNYHPEESKDMVLLQRKILFSVLQSLK